MSRRAGILALSAFVVAVLALGSYFIFVNGRPDGAAVQSAQSARTRGSPAAAPKRLSGARRPVPPAKVVPLEGVVLADGAPAPEVEVTLTRSAMGESTSATSPKTATDARGRFSFGTQQPDVVAISARRLGRETIVSLDLRNPGVDTRSIVLHLATCARFTSGRVTSDEGSPLERIPIALATGPQETPVLVPLGETGADGRFRVCTRDGLLIGGGQVELVSIPPVEAVGDIIVSQAVRFRGQVLDAVGTPVRSAKVYLLHTHHDRGEVQVVATTNAQGEWQVQTSPGCRSILAAANGRTAESEVQCGGPNEQVDVPPLLLGECPMAVSGVVKDGDGNPVEATLTIGGEPTTTDSAGRFESNCAAGGRIRLDGFSVTPTSVLHSTDNLTIIAQPNTIVTGTVSTGGAPAAGASVEATSDSDITPITALTDRRGTYELSLPPGRYFLGAYLNGLSATPVTVDVSRTSTSRPVDLSLALVNSVRGVALSEGGVRLYGVELGLRSAPNATVPLSEFRASSDKEGRFAFTRLAPGEYSLYPKSAAWTVASGSQSIALTFDGRTAVELTVALKATTTHTIKGRVIDAAGRPARSARVVVISRQVVAADGTFSVTVDQEASYGVSAISGDGRERCTGLLMKDDKFVTLHLHPRHTPQQRCREKD